MKIEQASESHADSVAAMVGELLEEIMSSTGVKAFNFNLDETAKRLQSFLVHGKYFVFTAEDAGKSIGFISLCESYALYAEGAFGTIQELYVRHAYRAQGVGKLLVEAAKEFASTRKWPRLEVTTPPLSHFERTLGFYEKEGFSISGGRKLKITL